MLSKIVNTMGIEKDKLTRSMAFELDNAIQILCPVNYGSQAERNHRINAFIENLKVRSAMGNTSPDISIDAVFEIVRKYQSADELNEYCAKVVYYDSENRSEFYRDEIILRATDLIEKHKLLISDGNYKLKNATTNLHFNEEYKELKKIVEEIKISRSVKEIIEAKIKKMESGLTEAYALIENSKESLTKILEGKEAKLDKGDLPAAVRQFVYLRFPEKRKIWNTSNSEM